jgi:PHP family Zn ribbon phosphoesterase
VAENIIVTCSHCGQRNRCRPALALKPRCGRCQQSIERETTLVIAVLTERGEMPPEYIPP